MTWKNAVNEKEESVSIDLNIYLKSAPVFLFQG